MVSCQVLRFGGIKYFDKQHSILQEFIIILYIWRDIQPYILNSWICQIFCFLLPELILYALCRCKYVQLSTDCRALMYINSYIVCSCMSVAVYLYVCTYVDIFYILYSYCCTEKTLSQCVEEFTIRSHDLTGLTLPGGHS